VTGLVATDIDGTLLRSDGTISARTRRAVAAVEAAGVPFVLVTGRPPRWLGPVRDQLGHRGVAICANGALVLDLHTDQVLRVDAFDVEVAREVLRRIRGLRPGLGVGVEWPDGFGHEPGYPRGTRRSELLPHVAVDVHDDEGFLARPVVKWLVRDREGPLDGLVEEATAALEGLATVTWSSLGLLEISADGVDKAAALARLAAEHGVDAARAVAFGDMPNDLAMLGWAGCGVAVANAHPLVLEAADEVTAANDDDGVAVVLERLVAPASAAG
jgi:Cof subfamily protein (haloacid dehalogenase superfamily)